MTDELTNKLCEYMVEKGGIADFEDDAEINYDFKCTPYIYEVLNRSSLEMDEDGDGLNCNSVLRAYWLTSGSVTVYKR